MIRLTPSFKEKVWGSTHLEPLFPNSPNKIGEVWFEGVDDLPLLIKFLFTSENLSVQVHPGDDYARLHHDCNGKTEMWHVLAAEPDAKIASGFRESITQEQLRQASLSGEIESLLHWHPAKPGDTFYIPAGTVHAIGAGLTICEIQQQSDVTYRLYDYGRPRELHLERASDVSVLGPAANVAKSSEGVLVESPYFTTSKLCISKATKNIPPSSRPTFLILIGGSGTLNGEPTRAGEVWYLEAGKQETVFSGDAQILITSS